MQAPPKKINDKKSAPTASKKPRGSQLSNIISRS